MSNWNTLPKIKLGVYPTPFYQLENISRLYNKSIWIKRDDLCGVALGGNKVRKLNICWRTPKSRAVTPCSPPAAPSPTTPCSPPPARHGWGCAAP